MVYLSLCFLFNLLSALAGPDGSDLRTDPVTRLREIVRERLEQAESVLSVGEETIHARAHVQQFYEKRMFEPAWVDTEGPLPGAHALLEALRDAVREGLDPELYHLLKAEALLDDLRTMPQPPDGVLLADLDLLLTDTFLIYSAHLSVGCVNPETYNPEWVPERPEVDLLDVLEASLEPEQLRESLEGLLPIHPGYSRLRDALTQYREIDAAGGWPEVPEGPAFRLGDNHERVASLRRRLVVTGELAPDMSGAPTRTDRNQSGPVNSVSHQGESEHGTPKLFEELSDGAASGGPRRFDEALQQAVQRFQARHGLEPDGVVGPQTLEALNVSAAERARQMALNLDRWRWLGQDLGNRYMLVNIPDFSLEVVEDGKTILRMAVVVGRTYRRTPVFSDTVRYIVLNPSWNTPRSIAVRDELPEIQKDPGFLERHGFRVLQGWGADEREIDPNEIDWSKLSARDFPYHLRQDPGPLNALGQIKFMFPNKFNVYLHDTPARGLFARLQRDFSSGCIRLERPIDLAEYVLKEDPGWTREAIVEAIEAEQKRTVPLHRRIAVHLQYWTAWVEEDGTVQFRKDLYGRDKRLADALQRLPTVL